MGKIKKRAGFTLIEVIVALGIFMIVVLALLSGFTFYYKYVRDLRFQTIGENLAQLQLEDLRNLPISILNKLANTPDFFWPSASSNPNYPKDTDGFGDNHIYYSGEIESEFRIENLKNVCGVEEDPSLPSLTLPESIEVKPRQDTITGEWYYDVTLNKWTFPYYKKEIWITDLTPDKNDERLKEFKIKVLIKWNFGGKTNSIVLTGERTYER